MLRFFGKYREKTEVFPGAGVGTGPYIHENRVFDSLLRYLFRSEEVDSAISPANTCKISRLAL